MGGSNSTPISGRGAQFPEDVNIDILLRLPVKSLLRLKVVCKRWYDFSKNFKSMHHKFNLVRQHRLLMCSAQIDTNTSINNHLFTILSNDQLTRVLSPDFNILANTNTYLYLLPESCNGIVCYYDYANSAIFLSNPATREFKQLPPTSFEPDPKFNQVGIIAFGFGSENVYDFKVIRLFIATKEKGVPGFKPTHKPFRAEIYTLSSNTWKQLHWSLDDRLTFHIHKGSFCANSFHFIANCHKPLGQTIICFGIDTGMFKTMELPPLNGSGDFVSLMVFKEFLATVCRFPSTSTDIWIMKDYGIVDSWTKLYNIRPPWESSIPLCFWGENDALLLRRMNRLFSCNHDPLMLESVEIVGHDTPILGPITIDGDNRDAQFAVYEETLISIG